MNKMLSLCEIAENRSNELGEHSQRVSLFCHLLALKAGLSRKDADLLRRVSLMHDVGKMEIPDYILSKPDKLTAEEFELIKPHTTIGYDILAKSPEAEIKAAAIVAGQHHESWDGSGYPNGLKGEEIHIFARITALADVFDSLLHRRAYKDKWPVDQVVESIKEQKERRFDPRLVEIFLEHFDEFIEINKSYPD